MTPRQPGVRVAPVRTRKTMADFLRVPHIVFAGDPAWVPPLNMIERRRLSRRHAPFFSFGDAEFFVAYRGVEPVGRISAQINRRHLARHADGTGHFGFFECVDDTVAARALISVSMAWLRARGLTRMIGPMNLSLNDEAGCLIDGFDSAPAVLMPHHPRWAGALLERAGLTKAIDSFAFRLTPTEVPPALFKLAERVQDIPGIVVRPFDMRRYTAEIEAIVDVFNDAWDANWGFVPLSAREVDALGAAMRPLVRGEYGRVVSIADRPVGVALALPNFNDVIARLNGRLLPVNWARLLWGLTVARPRRFRVALFGIRREYQATRLGGALAALLMRDLLVEMRKREIDWIELSWVLESNVATVRLAEMAGGRAVKTYRFYATPIPDHGRAVGD